MRKSKKISEKKKLHFCVRNAKEKETTQICFTAALVCVITVKMRLSE